MNATNYYVSTTRLVLQADPDCPSSWQDLYTALPILRNSLSCTVCQNLLSEPYTPEETTCEHHVCKSCKGGVKKLRPSCSWCKDYSKYTENVQLRILIQNYKKLCGLIKITKMFGHIIRNAEHGRLIRDIIRESEGEKIEQPLVVDHLEPAPAPPHPTSPTTVEAPQAPTQGGLGPGLPEGAAQVRGGQVCGGGPSGPSGPCGPSSRSGGLARGPRGGPRGGCQTEVEPPDEIISSPYSKLKVKPPVTTASELLVQAAKVDLEARFSPLQPTPVASPTYPGPVPTPQGDSPGPVILTRPQSGGIRKVRQEAFILDPLKGRADLPRPNNQHGPGPKVISVLQWRQNK